MTGVPWFAEVFHRYLIWKGVVLAACAPLAAFAGWWPPALLLCYSGAAMLTAAAVRRFA